MERWRKYFYVTPEGECKTRLMENDKKVYYINDVGNRKIGVLL